ncbi:hypothetical protein MMC32_007621 [Xylographa parallela]|nr:hypothetical protein [Xylographa parallela]
MGEDDNVVIDTGAGGSQVFTQEYLLCWIQRELNSGKPLTDIVVSSYNVDGKMEEVQLTAEIWQHSLIDGPSSQIFMPIWQSYTTALASRRTILSHLSEDKKFFQRCQNFVYDLHSFTKYQSKRRLEGTGHEYYLGKPYFEPAQVDMILSIEIMGGTVASKLRELAQKKATTYDTICASHDLAPIFELALGVSWNSVTGKCDILHP